MEETEYTQRIIIS